MNYYPWIKYKKGDIVRNIKSGSVYTVEEGLKGKNGGWIRVYDWPGFWPANAFEFVLGKPASDKKSQPKKVKKPKNKPRTTTLAAQAPEPAPLPAWVSGPYPVLLRHTPTDKIVLALTVTKGIEVNPTVNTDWNLKEPRNYEVYDGWIKIRNKPRG